MTNVEMIMAAVEALGYQAQIDSEGDVVLRYQTKTFCILSKEYDESYVVVLFPQFSEIKEGEEALVLAACNKINRDFKLVKLYADKSLKTVSACCEFYFTDDKSLVRNIEHSFKVLGIVRTAYRNAVRELCS